MSDYSAYADSAQAREMDRRMERKVDYWGNPLVKPVPTVHEYDYEAAAARELAERKSVARRIGIAIGQMEVFFQTPPTPIESAPHGARGSDMSQSQELAILPAKEVALTVFSTPNGLDPYLQAVRNKLDNFIASAPDVKTKKGQDAYRSIAYDLAGSKTDLDKFGKELAAELKDVPKKIDAERKRVRELLTSWQEEVRKPLTDWEAAEATRIKGHKDSIQWLEGLAEGLGDLTAELIAKRIEDAEAFVIGTHLDEFEADAARAKDALLGKLRTSLAARIKHEDELAKIAQFNAEKAKRERIEHEAQIARAAAQKAQQDADERAQADRQAATKRETDLLEQAEKQRLQLQLQAEQAERNALQAKADKEAAERKAAQDLLDAQERQKAAVEKARLDEIARQRAAADEIIRQEKLRADDVEHRRAINRAAIVAFMTNGMTEACAKQAITLIASRQIPAISIAY